MIKYIFIIFFIFLSCDFLNKNQESNEDINIDVDEYFSFNTSNQVAFYFFDSVLVNNQLLDTTDWVDAFKNNSLVLNKCNKFRLFSLFLTNY